MIERFEHPIAEDHTCRVKENPPSLPCATLGRSASLVHEPLSAGIRLLGIDPIQERHHAACGRRLTSDPRGAVRPTCRPFSLSLLPLSISSLLLPCLTLENRLTKIREIRNRADCPMRASSTVRAPKGQRNPLKLHSGRCAMRRMGTANRAHVDREPSLRL
jgi:hypothetical protein